MTRLFLVRHAETAWTVEDRMCGASDPPLNARGSYMAEALARRLADIGFAAVYSSPAQRCWATASAIAGVNAGMYAERTTGRGSVGLAPPPLVPHRVADLREYDFGEWEGLAYREVQRDPRYAAWSTDTLSVPAPGGDAARTVAMRASAAMTAIIAAHAGQDVAVVSHKTVIRLLLCLWSGAPLAGFRRLFRQDACALNIVHIADDGTPRLDLLNDTAHLHDLWRHPLNR